MNREQIQEIIKDWRHQLNISKHRVEREFDKMPSDEKEIVFALAKIVPLDQVNSSIKPQNLRDFTKSGQRKIAKAFQKIRVISNRLPQGISINEFYLTDKEVNYANRSY
ncbi:hypothetical protein [Pasteurella multocida]|uniref:hypothetical protein n=1 Tax=Pasteurella multocida TaxID=747 RepID=UPI002C3A4F41|nr:hypothetical protein [Pasteurella multocida]MEB3457156.1 hypothetical protein [Pasteurella multocida]